MEPRTIGKSTIDYRVPYADSDKMGVVYYANYLVYFERSRNELLRELGFSYREMEARGWLLPVLEAHVHYRRPAHYDDLLTVSAEATILSPVRLRVDCVVARDAFPLVHGYTVHASLSAERRRPVPLPAPLLER